MFLHAHVRNTTKEASNDLTDDLRIGRFLCILFKFFRLHSYLAYAWLRCFPAREPLANSPASWRDVTMRRAHVDASRRRSIASSTRSDERHWGGFVVSVSRAVQMRPSPRTRTLALARAPAPPASARSPPRRWIPAHREAVMTQRWRRLDVYGRCVVRMRLCKGSGAASCTGGRL